MSATPTIVICSGAWPLAIFFQPLIQAFEAQQHVAICKVPESYPAFDPSNPVKRNYDGLFLRDKVLNPLLEEGKDIVVFMHSYGGVYGAEALEGTSKKERAAKGLKGGVIAAIFNAAFIAPKGVSAMSAMGLDPENLPEYLEHDRTTGLVGFKKGAAKAMLFHDLPDDEANRLADMLPKQPLTCFSTPAHWDPYHDPNFKGKLGYIYTEADRALPLAIQEAFVETAAIGFTYVLKNSSHSPHHEQPGVLAQVVLDMINAIAKED
ncbi:hypothetical protein ANO14919_137040 [Xylariales sp. No.14919]|nr:hypothetical protein ANO14919_137040 [Xylariales sp. No.14919]